MAVLTSNGAAIRACQELLSIQILHPNDNNADLEKQIWKALDNFLEAACINPERPPLSEPSVSGAHPAPSLASRPQFLTPGKPQSVASLAVSIDDTPFHANSGMTYSYPEMKSRTHNKIDPFLRTELRNAVWQNVRGFHHFFSVDEAEWECAVNCPARGCRCPLFPPARAFPPASGVGQFPGSNPSEKDVVQWVRRFSGATQHQGRQETGQWQTSGGKPLKHSKEDSLRKCDIFLANTDIDTESDDDSDATYIPVPADNETSRYSWTEVLVPGELKASSGKDGDPDTVVQLAGYVREVFGAQPTRRLVHGFTICGSIFRCYLFDRAGVSASTAFNICKNARALNLFVRVLCAYKLMTPVEMGFDPKYRAERGDVFVSTSKVMQPTWFDFEGRTFRLIDTLFHRSVIVSRGTLCWLAREEDGKGPGVLCVIKDSWRAAWRPAEGDLLRLAASRGVVGLPKPIVYGDVELAGVLDSAENLRQGLDYKSARSVKIGEKDADNMYLLSSAAEPGQKAFTTSALLTMNDVAGPRKASVLSKKRPAGDQPSLDRQKMARIGPLTPGGTGDSKPTMARTRQQTRQQQISIDSHSGAGTTPIVGSPRASSSLAAGTSTGIFSDDAVSPPQGLAIRKGTNQPYMNVIHSVIVLTPVGRKIAQYTSLIELLEALRDAVKCHQSLVEQGGILHRDISPNNIMITEKPADSSLRGFLIDLDLAKQLPRPVADDGTSNSSNPASSSPRRRTGTMQFMAIEVLEGSAQHTYRHDLESFLYVLIYLCICTPHDHDAKKRKNRMEAWTAKFSPNNKIAEMENMQQFAAMQKEFAPSMRALTGVVGELRNVLFPPAAGGGFFHGTWEGVKERGRVYREVIGAFENGIEALRVGIVE